MKKIFENCPDIDSTYPDCILFECEDDPENFYVDFFCYYESYPAEKPIITREEVIASLPEGYLESFPPDRREEMIDFEMSEKEIWANSEMCCCTRRLSPQEVANFPYHFKDVQLSEEGWARLDKAIDEFGESAPGVDGEQ